MRNRERGEVLSLRPRCNPLRRMKVRTIVKVIVTVMMIVMHMKKKMRRKKKKKKKIARMMMNQV